MNKKDLVKAVAEQANIKKKSASQAIYALFKTITESLKKVEPVTLTGFGSFKISKRAAMIFPTISKAAVIQFALIYFIILYAAQTMEAPETNDKKGAQGSSYHNEDTTISDGSDLDIFVNEILTNEQGPLSQRKRLKKGVARGRCFYEKLPALDAKKPLQALSASLTQSGLFNDNLSSKDENPFLSHTPKRSIATATSEDSDTDISSDETSESEQRLHSKRKRLKGKESKERPKFSVNEFRGLPEQYTRPRLISSSCDPEIKIESDEESTEENVCRYVLQPLPALASVIDMGTKLKLLANVYLGKIDHLANIFFPQYVLKVEQPNKAIKEGDPYFFTTPKGEICVFASGGTQNAWEKTVARVYEIFFDRKVKIIRARWIQKHLPPTRSLTEEFEGRENRLHSEFYYDLFFTHFFLPSLREKYGDSVKKLTINAFSWWEVCDSCNNNYLAKHQKLCANQGIGGLIFNIGATRKYAHHYPPATTIMGYRVPQTQEGRAWDEIWSKLKTYVHKYPNNTDEKQKFWTKTAAGLELCKWLGQAFVENTRPLERMAVMPNKRGDILKFYNEMREEDTEDLQNLISYLREENWDLSCWYKYPYAESIQGKWKQHALQIVMPHFGWKILHEFDAEYGDSQCEMCGNEDVFHMSLVYHSKHQVTKKLLELTKEEKLRDELFPLGTPFDELSESMQKKRRQSLLVGSNCVSVLQIRRGQLDEMRAKKRTRLEFEVNLKGSDRAEAKALFEWMWDESIKKKGSSLSSRYISTNSDWSFEKLEPLLEILLQSKKIQKVRKGSYVIKELGEKAPEPQLASREELFQDKQNQKRERKVQNEAYQRQIEARRAVEREEAARREDERREAKRKEDIKRDWLDVSQWRETPKGGYSRRLGNAWINVFRQGQNWKYVFENQFSAPYPTVQDALQASYDQYLNR
ncbi:HU family DNA-binding protein [Candidatus Odyssella acanthamoebae]|uniref:HU family DNA-binding protein n=1 Tax=Candidatus Odyssella acanthamoebae TaxID=91604 RepID=UPI00056E3A5E|nr:HU family DNA-binding protein [Candidatus Paracaedibacter acanthamoebae]